MNIGPSESFRLPFTKPSQPHERRLPGFGWLPNRVRNHFIAMVGEFAGTFLFLFFAFSATQVANAGTGNTSSDNEQGGITQAPNPGALLYISLAFGFSLAVNAWVFFRITGGLFNPAVTLGMCLIGAVKWWRGLLIFISQILGSMAAAGVVSALFPSAMNVSTTLGGGTSIVRGLFIEMFLTAELVFTIFMLAAEKHKGTFLAPIGIGLALFIAELAGVFFTGGSLNPARSFGPCVVLHAFPGYHWIYWLGPALGSVIAVGFYKLVKILEYETANPGQDFNDKEAEVFNVDEDTAATAADVARPNIAIGRSEYIADRGGIYQSQDVRQTAGTTTSPRAPAKYSTITEEKPSTGAPSLPNPVPYSPTSSGRPVSGTTAAGTRYDGADKRSSSDRTRISLDRDLHRAPSHVTDEKKRRSSSGGRAHHDDLYIPVDRYRAASEAENGAIGGDYRVSGL